MYTSETELTVFGSGLVGICGGEQGMVKEEGTPTQPTMSVG